MNVIDFIIVMVVSVLGSFAMMVLSIKLLIPSNVIKMAKAAASTLGKASAQSRDTKRYRKFQEEAKVKAVKVVAEELAPPILRPLVLKMQEYMSPDEIVAVMQDEKFISGAMNGYKIVEGVASKIGIGLKRLAGIEIPGIPGLTDSKKGIGKSHKS